LFRAGALLAGAFIPWVFRLGALISYDVQVGLFDYSIIGYSIAILGLAHGLHRHGMIEVTPMTYERVVKGMTDGWIVVDMNNNIVDINPAAEGIVGHSRAALYGKPIRSILTDWPDISNVMGNGRELEMRRSVRAQSNWRYLNVHISSLKDEHERPFGQLITWRDITERKQSEEARQRARDEMFVLLNAVSNAASHTINLDDFLSESLYQLIYPFQSQVAAVLLLDSADANPRLGILRLAAHFGFSPAGAREMDVVFANIPIFNNVTQTRQPAAIEDAQHDTRTPSVLKDAGIASLVILPLLTQAGENGKLLGCIFLGRMEILPYSHDEVIRLTALSEQIANLIDSDRRRQLAIALSEREKLMRDLHDSVSQKLYGLVTLTEAAQAGWEAGSKVPPTQVLAKIGENARQAVKEMRLFLYQMQPVDLEKGNIISALHHRLGAVEGRADIQARFLPDEKISLSKDKEVALYFIAQEALNNILKHAHATTVTVRLRQTRQNVILEVTDNGKGFDLDQVEQGGMGLQNMRARAMQVKGTLKIISTPGQGTTIRATVSKDRMPDRVKQR
jgi:PAS domain S-box-containing protein